MKSIGEILKNEDSFSLCPKCNTPTECYIGEGRDRRRITCSCDCKRKAYEEEQAYWEEIDRRSRVESTRQSAYSRAKFKEYTFDADDRSVPEVTNKCKRYAANFKEFKSKGRGLLLWGQPGSGKTFLALCIANALIEQQIQVRVTTLTEVIRNAQDFDNAENHFNRLMRCQLIVLDDLGTERGSTFAQEAIYRFIDECYTRHIPLIITTNYTPSMFEAIAKNTKDESNIVFARIYSRLLERCLPIKLSGVDRRKGLGDDGRKEMLALLEGDE